MLFEKAYVIVRRQIILLQSSTPKYESQDLYKIETLIAHPLLTNYVNINMDNKILSTELAK